MKKLSVIGAAAMVAAASGVSANSAQSQLAAAEVETARGLFADFNCGACHVMEAAGGNGGSGPAFDGNSALTAAGIAQIVADGEGGMPAYGEAMSEEQIDLLARYIIAAKR